MNVLAKITSKTINKFIYFLYQKTKIMKKVIFNISKITEKNFIDNNEKSKYKNHHLQNPVCSKEEDETLISISKIMKRNKWKYASSILHNRTPLQCHLRYKLINPSIKRGRREPQIT